MQRKIVLEGPDSAGKTTLAEWISQAAEARGLTPNIVKSPAGKDMSWKPMWDNWVETLDDFHGGNPLILDRTPEISEIVYAYDRERPRLRSVTTSINSINGTDAMVIFCIPTPYTPEGLHSTPEGLTYTRRGLDQARERYQWVRWMMLWSTPRTARIMTYNYKDPRNQTKVYEEVLEWLT